MRVKISQSKTRAGSCCWTGKWQLNSRKSLFPRAQRPKFIALGF